MIGGWYPTASPVMAADLTLWGPGANQEDGAEQKLGLLGHRSYGQPGATARLTTASAGLGSR